PLLCLVRDGKQALHVVVREKAVLDCQRLRQRKEDLPGHLIPKSPVAHTCPLCQYALFDPAPCDLAGKDRVQYIHPITSVSVFGIYTSILYPYSEIVNTVIKK